MDPENKRGFNNTAPVPFNGVGFENWGAGTADQSIWATEDDYQAWNTENPPDSSYGTEPPNKRFRNAQSSGDFIVVETTGDINNNNNGGAGSNRSKAIGKMFFKTKLCCKFRIGACPYVTNCNFAHGIEELRHPPENWQEIVAAQDQETREEHSIPTFNSSDTIRVDSQRSFKGRHCKKFYTEEGCPYGENCTFLHDEQTRARESVAISLSPTVVGGSVFAGSGSDAVNMKPSNWKTRICNKWETTGNCPFGNKCHFAHGLQELHNYGGGLLETQARDSSSSFSDSRQVAMSSSNTTMDAIAASTPLTTSNMGGGVPLPRPSSIPSQRPPGQRPPQKWKGPDKISKIYGDWIDDLD